MRHPDLDMLARIGVVPVVRADDEKTACAAVEALVEGGIPVCEITMTVPGALRVMTFLSENFGNDLTVGAGTVTSAEMGRKVIDAGCRFVVTPTVNPDVIVLCQKADVCIIGGALTPSEIHQVWAAGASAVKVFPIKAVGGTQYIKMIHEPFPEIDLVPTGGVDLETLPGYLKAGAMFVGAGGDLIDKSALSEGRFHEIAQRAQQYREVIQNVQAGNV